MFGILGAKFGADFFGVQGGGRRNNCFIPTDDNAVLWENTPKLCPDMPNMY